VRLGSYMTEESRAKMSVVRMGHLVSLETRAKQSAALMGHAPTGPEHHTVEARARMSAAEAGHPTSPETRAKMSMAMIGPLGSHWKGGKKAHWARGRAKRRGLGYVYLNASFPGCEGHHVDGELVINMPKKLHRSVYHRQRDGRGMAQINVIAYSFLFNQEVEAAIAAKESS